VNATPAELDAAVARLRAVAQARRDGATWAQIGARYGVSRQEAKRGFRLLERDTRREFLLAAQAATLTG
jgi:transposase-like protein